MKKKLLVLAVVVMAVALCLSVAGIASAEATVTAQADYYVGDYGDLFADKGDKQQEYLNEYGTQAVVVFGQVADADPAQYEYGVVFYPADEELSASNGKLFSAKSVNAEGKFGIAVSLSGEFLNSGAWKVATYLVPKSAVNKDGVTFGETTISKPATDIIFSTESLAAPASITLTDDVVTWDSVEGADSYNVYIKWTNESDYSLVKNTTSTSFDVTEYLASLGTDGLKARDGKYAAMRVAAVSGGVYGEYATLDNILGYNDGNYALYVAHDKASFVDVKAQGLRYIVLANDIDLGDITPTSKFRTARGVGTYTAQGATDTFASVKINGLGNKLSYSYSDQEVAPSQSGAQFGLFWIISSDLGAKSEIWNLSLDADYTQYGTYDDYHMNALAYTLRANVKDCYFKVRGYTVDRNSSGRMRLSLVYDAKESTFTNCVFDIVSYGNDGLPRAQGYTSSRGGAVAISGAPTSITNSAFIKSTEKGDNYWSGNATAIIDSAFYTDFDSFISEWNAGTLAGKANYEAAGWAVSDGYALSFKGDAVYAVPYSAPANLACDTDVLTWDSVDGAEKYTVQVKWTNDTEWTDLDPVTATSWSVTDYLKGLTTEELQAKAGQTLTVGVAAYSTGRYGEYATMNVFDNMNLAVAATVADLKAYTDDNTTKTAYYTVLADDIVIEENVATASGTAVVGSYQRGWLNGLGHTISYVYDDTGMTVSNGGYFSGLYTAIGTERVIKIMNLGVDGEITSARTFDNWHGNLLAHKLQGEMYNCYFKLRAYTPNLAASAKSRINFVRQLVSNSTGAYRGELYNCVFDMITYGKDGTARKGGSSLCDTMISRNESSVMANGASKIISNCAFIMNQTQDRTWSESDQYITITDSAFYADFGAFITAWNEGTLAGKANYQAAGFNVSGDAVTFNGVQINA